MIRDSDSPFASPILLVRKKDGELRLCVDYRSLNEIMKRDRHPLPIIEDQINFLAGKTRFISLDLFSGYHQVPISKESIEKTAFVTPEGQYEYLCVPFGLFNASSVFARLISAVVNF